MAGADNLKGHSFRDKPERINRNGRPKGSIVYVKDLAKMAAEELSKPGKTKETVAGDIIEMLIHKKLLLKEDITAMKLLMELLGQINLLVLLAFSQELLVYKFQRSFKCTS
jgi:hypothetical protein